MYIHADMQGSGTLLLALDGVLVGLVVEADTREGWVRRYDTRQLQYDVHTGMVAGPTTKATRSAGSLADWKSFSVEAQDEYRSRITACPIVRVEGKVDFVGDTATDPDWMIAQRLAAVRIRHGLPIDVSVAHDISGVVASVLERLAAQLRSGSMVATNFGQTRAIDRFPIPDDKYQFQPTGCMRVSVDYEIPSVVRAHEEAKAVWSREHPELVPEYVRRCTEGEAKIVEDVEANIDHRVRSAQLRSQIRK